jgi:hypothetical protein
MKEISAALVKAQKEFGPALKTSTNPHFRSKYADLSACVEAVIDALNNNGIMLMQPTHLCEDGVIVETIFLHESGEQISGGKLHVPASKHDAQGYGSALSYARRYSLMASCGIAPEDDDGNAASSTAPKPAPKPVAKLANTPAPAIMEGKSDGSKDDGPWFMKVTTEPGTDIGAWIQAVDDAATVALEFAQSKDDVMTIFKKNRNIFDRLKQESEGAHKILMDKFTKAKKQFETGAE